MNLFYYIVESEFKVVAIFEEEHFAEIFAMFYSRAVTKKIVVVIKRRKTAILASKELFCLN